jgi:hypothetical protein
VGLNKKLNLKEKDIEELERNLAQSADEHQINSRLMKQSIDEQLHQAKMQNTSDMKQKQDENT